MLLLSFQIESFSIIDQESFGSDPTALASKLAILAAANSHASVNDDEPISVDAETQARLEALLEAAGIY